MKKETVKKTKTKKISAIKKESFLSQVKKEVDKVRWPNKKEMIKYSSATISFVVFFGLFFMLSDLLIAAVKMVMV